MWIISLYVNYLPNSDLDDINLLKANYVNNDTPLTDWGSIEEFNSKSSAPDDCLWKHGKDKFFS